jgi:hypothetical protein
MSAFLGYSSTSEVAGSSRWTIGTAPTIPQYNFEVSSYPIIRFYPVGGIPADAFVPKKIGDDVNPADVIAAILVDEYGKLGLGTGVLNQASFAKAGETLAAEGHGYSRSIEEDISAEDLLKEIIHQIDGAMYVHPFTGLWHLKLIRPDFDPNLVPRINPGNCVRIENFTLLSPADTPSTVRIQYTSRLDDYTPRHAMARDHANASGQPGGVREVEFRMPGVSNSTLAEKLAARELAAISRPLKTCSAVVDRSFLTVFPGDAVALDWPALHLSGVIMRVAAVDWGGPESNVVTLSLVEDYFFVYRKKVAQVTPVAPFPTHVIE